MLKHGRGLLRAQHNQHAKQRLTPQLQTMQLSGCSAGPCLQREKLF